MEGRTPPQQTGQITGRRKRARKSRKPAEVEPQKKPSSQSQELPKRILTALVSMRLIISDRSLLQGRVFKKSPSHCLVYLMTHSTSNEIPPWSAQSQPFLFTENRCQSFSRFSEIGEPFGTQPALYITES